MDFGFEHLFFWQIHASRDVSGVKSGLLHPLSAAAREHRNGTEQSRQKSRLQRFGKTSEATRVLNGGPAERLDMLQMPYRGAGTALHGHIIKKGYRPQPENPATTFWYSIQCRTRPD